MNLSFKDYLAENTLETSKFDKYKGIVISKLNSGADLRLGKDGKAGSFNKKDFDEDELKALANAKSVEDFNKALPKALKERGIKWTAIFKGDFTGYSEGFASGNKGGEFEKQFFQMIQDGINGNPSEEYKNLLAAIGVTKLFGASLDGGNNTKRPISFSGNKIKIGKGFENIGDVVTDITVFTGENESKPVYLSLKYGGTTSFMNIGIKNILNEKFFKSSSVSGDAKTLLNSLGIDAKKFKETFNAYGTDKAVSESQPIDLKKTGGFKEIAKQAIGYGYILVHKKGSTIHYRDMRTENDVNTYVETKATSATVYYGGISGGGKRVDVVVEYPMIDFKFNIRSKDGSVYPTHLNADYKFKN